MKVISAILVVRLDDENDLDAVVALDEMLATVGFDGPLDTTCEPVPPGDDTIRVEFVPALK